MDKYIAEENSKWKNLYKMGGVAAIISAVLLLIEIIVFTLWPQPTTALGYFTLIQSNKLIGLIDFYLLEFIAYALFIPIFLALYMALKRLNESYMLLSITLAIVGITIFLATNNSFSMIPLSNQYLIATTEVQKSILLAAGQTLLVNTGQRAVGGFNTGFLLISIAGLLISKIMLQSNIFSKTTAYVGILAFAISLADYLRIIFLPSELILLLIIAILSGILLLVWLVLIGRSLILFSTK
ncbi:MAG: hypothetical protein CIT01_04425 [Methanobacterium sp. BRmetb2]|jgi:hypothetical protein|nr:MAG: hypothetical protein CIT01_04425 [Methanobacterium sp. BRmetb2]